MSTPSLAIETLVRLVREEVLAGSADERDALAQILPNLEVKPGDAAWADGRDVVGEAFERLAPAAERRRLGQFFTPLWVARPMAEWLLAGSPDLLLDPGVGSGSLIIATAAARGKANTRLLGFDVDSVALEMARTTARIRDIHHFELRQADFLLDVVKDRPQAIICNPPYTRHQELPAELKAEIHDGLSARLGESFSRLASLHVLFLLRALEISADDARIAFLTPAHWLDMNYARRIKALVLEQAHVEAIVTFPVKSRLFDHAITSAGVTLIRKGVSGTLPTRIVRLDQGSATERGVRDAISAAERGRAVVLHPEGKWSQATRAQSRGGVKLGELAHVRRGIATGCNAFFVLSEARRRELRLEERDLLPCITSPRHFDGTTLRRSDLESMGDDVPRWLLSLKTAPRSGPMLSYLRRGHREFGVRDRTLVRQRERAGRKWFQVEAEVRGPILFRYLNASAARFVRNLADVAPLNNWLVIQPHAGVDVDDLFAVLQTLHGALAVEQGSRHYGKGLWKLEPRELRDLVLPARARTLIPPT